MNILKRGLNGLVSHSNQFIFKKLFDSYFSSETKSGKEMFGIETGVLKTIYVTL